MYSKKQNQTNIKTFNFNSANYKNEFLQDQKNNLSLTSSSFALFLDGLPFAFLPVAEKLRFYSFTICKLAVLSSKARTSN